MPRVLSSIPAPLRRKLLEADVRPECTAGLLRTLRAFQNLEPWALRLFDASGKYPTGLFEGSHVDMGAFDECLRTVVRDGFGNVLSQGQYCNLLVYVNNGTAIEEMLQSFSDVLHPRLQYFKSYFSYKESPVGRLAVCFLRDCNQQDLQTLLGTVAAGTYVDCFTDSDPKHNENRSALFKFITAFSARSNTRYLLTVADKAKPDQYALQFLHGMRFFSILHIVMGHCPSVMSDTWFTKQTKNGLVVFIVAVTRRLIRTCIPLFFVILCLYALEPFVDGPNTKAFFQNLHNEVSSHWWHLVLQIRNFCKITGKDVLPHTWYLSADFQLFVISLLVLLIFKGRKMTILGVFTLLSLLGCVVGTCVVAGLELPPFMIFPGPIPELMLRTLVEYYIRPYYHAVCYFGGCMTYLIKEDFRQTMTSKRLRQVVWCGSVACGLFCVFVKFAWYTNLNPVPQGVTLLAAFLDRILWTLFLAWITLTCCTGRGGVLSKLLSWNAYVPLSKLSFGVYLIHVPFLHLWFHSSRERRFWSVFNQVTLLFALLVWSFLLSYLAYLVCEAPTAALDKLVFTKLIVGRRNKRQTTNTLRKREARSSRMGASDMKKQGMAEDSVVTRC
ncbi:hypothetical protein MTO96_019772 [Rhipicephalus appendiculatus]